MLIECPYCAVSLGSASACYWHLRNEYGLSHAEAYELTGEAIQAAKDWEAGNYDKVREHYKKHNFLGR
jgi:hypothetical protein